VQKREAPARDAAPGNGLITTAQLANKLDGARAESPRVRAQGGGVKYRLPTAAAIKGMMVSKSIPRRSSRARSPRRSRA